MSLHALTAHRSIVMPVMSACRLCSALTFRNEHRPGVEALTGRPSQAPCARNDHRRAERYGLSSLFKDGVMPRVHNERRVRGKRPTGVRAHGRDCSSGCGGGAAELRVQPSRQSSHEIRRATYAPNPSCSAASSSSSSENSRLRSSSRAAAKRSLGA